MYDSVVDLCVNHNKKYQDQDAINELLYDNRFKFLLHVLGAEYNYFGSTAKKQDATQGIKVLHHVRTHGNYEKLYMKD